MELLCGYPQCRKCSGNGSKIAQAGGSGFKSSGNFNACRTKNYRIQSFGITCTLTIHQCWGNMRVVDIIDHA
jgi:hypothetical protein